MGGRGIVVGWPLGRAILPQPGVGPGFAPVCNARPGLVDCRTRRTRPPMPPTTRVLSLALVLLATACGSRGAATAGAAAVAAPAPDPVSSAAWQADMARFAAEDAADPAAPGVVVFTGSSSVRMWDTLAQDFPGIAVRNRGFGGSQVRDATWFADEVAIRHAPSRIVLYAGDNDIDAGRSPRQVLADVQAFAARIHRDLPGTPIGYLAIKPSLLRIAQLPAQQQANALVRAWAEGHDAVDFIDVATPMLDDRGRPRPELFLADGLHLNAAGYRLWRGIVARWLEAPPRGAGTHLPHRPGAPASRPPTGASAWAHPRSAPPSASPPPSSGHR